MTTCYAQASAPQPPSHSPIPYKQSEPVSEVNRTGALLALLLLAGAAYAAFRYGGKKGLKFPLKPIPNKRLKLVETLHLSNRSKVYLLEVDGQSVMLSDTANGSQLRIVSSEVQKNERSNASDS